MSRFIAVFLALCTVLPAMEWLYNLFGWDEPPKIWAFTITTFFAVFYLGMFVCTYQVSIVSGRLEKCATAKAKLEKQVLKNRLSSKKN